MQFLGKKDLDSQVAGVITCLQSDLDVLGKESDDALKAFRDTLEKLDGVNGRIDSKMTLAQDHISSLTKLSETLLAQRDANNKTRDKIAEFLA